MTAKEELCPFNPFLDERSGRVHFPDWDGVASASAALDEDDQAGSFTAEAADPDEDPDCAGTASEAAEISKVIDGVHTVNISLSESDAIDNGVAGTAAFAAGVRDADVRAERESERFFSSEAAACLRTPLKAIAAESSRARGVGIASPRGCCEHPKGNIYASRLSLDVSGEHSADAVRDSFSREWNGADSFVASEHQPLEQWQYAAVTSPTYHLSDSDGTNRTVAVQTDWSASPWEVMDFVRSSVHGGNGQARCAGESARHACAPGSTSGPSLLPHTPVNIRSARPPLAQTPGAVQNAYGTESPGAFCIGIADMSPVARRPDVSPALSVASIAGPSPVFCKGPLQSVSPRPRPSSSFNTQSTLRWDKCSHEVSFALSPPSMTGSNSRSPRAALESPDAQSVSSSPNSSRARRQLEFSLVSDMSEHDRDTVCNARSEISAPISDILASETRGQSGGETGSTCSGKGSAVRNGAQGRSESVGERRRTAPRPRRTLPSRRQTRLDKACKREKESAAAEEEEEERQAPGARRSPPHAHQVAQRARGAIHVAGTGEAPGASYMHSPVDRSTAAYLASSVYYRRLFGSWPMGARPFGKLESPVPPLRAASDSGVDWSSPETPARVSGRIRRSFPLSPGTAVGRPNASSTNLYSHAGLEEFRSGSWRRAGHGRKPGLPFASGARGAST